MAKKEFHINEFLKDQEIESKSRIKKAMSKNSGDPFGRPYEEGVTTLTSKVVTYFKQKSFFNFESFEKPKSKKSNKFMAYGNSKFKGDYDIEAVEEMKLKKKNQKEHKSFFQKIFQLFK